MQYLNKISQFSTDISYIKGNHNTVADTFSKTDILTVAHDLIAGEQAVDPTIPVTLIHASL